MSDKLNASVEYKSLNDNTRSLWPKNESMNVLNPCVSSEDLSSMQCKLGAA